MEYRKFDRGYVLRLDPGEEIVASLTRLVEEEKIELASVSALGAANDVTIGIFNTTEKQYYSQRYQGDYEISALVGNVTRKDGEPYLHLHITIGNPVTGEVHAGHLSSATISATLELFLQVWDGRVGRKFSDTVGLNLLEF
ncbi:PPC domain-containing DNA-binding protein [Pseudoflavonifractor phocaeensis]|uniref:PPC domain-containing DNA-binding protein n=1 Tax=Pseudoflavonifractor phocaeensis TaxID=1870988 RepID=UPI001F3C876B|nr:PPC domain-containing DNA-binding protein [Pseudoflavonifractor phocaeensis]MCF2662601.1 DNA-binding protein [Pseudoflavonifractor phocaeensis]